MKILHSFPIEVVDIIKKIGIIVGEFDEDKNIVNFLNLPQWFKEDALGHIFEVPFSELPDSAKHIHLSYRDYKRVFTIEEMKETALAMANWGAGFETALPPNEYFKARFGIDLEKTN